MKQFGAVFCLLIGLIHSANTQEVSARAWADSTTFLVGEAITVHVSLTHSRPLELSSLVGDTLGAFHILSRSSIEKEKTGSTTSFTVATYDSGTAILPPLQFSYTVPPDTARRVVATNPLIFTIRLVDVDTTQDIKDIKPPLSIPVTLAEISLILGAIVGAGLLVYAFVQYRKRRKVGAIDEEHLPPPRPAHVVALEELALLKEKRLWQQGLIKPYYTEVSEIVRRYFENRFGFLSLEQTTDETLGNLRRFSVAQPVLPQVETLLRRADLVKFAKYQPTIPEHEETLSFAFEIVDATKVIERPVGIEEKEKEAREAVHV